MFSAGLNGHPNRNMEDSDAENKVDYNTWIKKFQTGRKLVRGHKIVLVIFGQRKRLISALAKKKKKPEVKLKSFRALSRLLYFACVSLRPCIFFFFLSYYSLVFLLCFQKAMFFSFIILIFNFAYTFSLTVQSE